jgi:hypothetical protein
MKQFAGGFAGVKSYPVGRMNELVYPVDGGMEVPPMYACMHVCMYACMHACIR